MPEKLVIVGSGVTGMAIAYVLADTYDITIIARDLPGDLGQGWASPWAGAVFHPDHKSEGMARRMQRTSFDFYIALAESTPGSGVKTYPMTEFFDDPDLHQDTAETIWYRNLMPSYRVLPASELPKGMTMGLRYDSLSINPLVFLPWLKKELVGKGVIFVRKEIQSLEEARRITGAKMAINASGNGARQLAGDEDAVPVRGQTMFVQTKYAELLMIDGSKDYTYIIPRPLSGGVIIGGIKSSRLDTAVDHKLKPNILRRVNEATNGAFQGLDVDGRDVTDIIGFRPGRKRGLRVEFEREKGGDTVHAYGVGGAGYIYSFGVAERVKEILVERRCGETAKL